MSVPDTKDWQLWLIVGVSLILVAVILFIAFLILRSAQKTEPEGEAALAPSPGSQISTSVRGAVDVLQARVMGGSYRYRVPWVLMVGTRDAETSSVLKHLASAALQSDQGGTLHDGRISLGFLNKGVLMDAPGSLLLGPSPGVASDESAWNQLLRSLTWHRPARPLDGLVLAVSATELLAKDADLSALGGLIRAKLDHLQSAIGLVLPIYILVTKCDGSVPGFRSYCQQVEPSQRKEIFGWSNGHSLDSVFTWVWVDEAMSAIRRTLHRQQLGFFAARTIPRASDDIYVFPACLETLRDPLQAFLTQLFVPVSYRETHYFRGVYFCGAERPDETPDEGAQVPAMLGVDSAPRQRIAFVDHLFEQKIFAEKSLARPVPQRFSFRNRVVAGIQVATVAFTAIVGIWLIVDAFRLSAQKKQIRAVVDSVNGSLRVTKDRGGTPRANLPAKGPQSAEAALNEAADLLDTMARLHRDRFWSPVMPASWHDPIESQIEDTVSQAFSKVVLRAFEMGLESKYAALLADAGSAPAANTASPKGTDESRKLANDGQSVDLDPEDTRSYRALSAYLARLLELEKNIARYNALKARGSGTIGDVRALLQYLTERTLPADDLFRNNVYFLRGVLETEGRGIDHLSQSRKQAADRTKALIGDFYAEWFERSPLARQVRALRNQIAGLDMPGRISTQELRSIGEGIAELDATLAGNTVNWLDPPFSRRTYPVLAKIDDSAFSEVFGPQFRGDIDAQGNQAWVDLRQGLLAESTPTSGHLLETPDTDRIRVSGPAHALGVNLIYLVNLDFMAGAGTDTPIVGPQTPVLWNADLLADGLKLNASWEKYQHDVLPSVPGSMRSVVKGIAQRGLSETLTDLAARAQTPLTEADDPLSAELKNFEQSLDPLKQLNTIGVKLGPAGTQLVARLHLYRQALRLIGAMNASNPHYSWLPDAPAKWDGTTPLSQALYTTQSPDELAAAVAADHERLRTLVESVSPLVQLLSAGGVPPPAGNQRVDWARLSDDLKQFNDKKPGNPIGALETFLTKDVDKIVPENSCQGGAADSRTGDPLIGAMNTLKASVVRACLLLVKKRYTLIADNFGPIAGKFPFSADKTASDEADPAKVAEFFRIYGQNIMGLTDALDRLGAIDPKDTAVRAGTRQAIDFLNKVEKIRPLFATADPDSPPALDVTVQFRSNQKHETPPANQIIDWSLKIGSQLVQFQQPANTIRWHYGDRLTLTMRYAKDGPNVPRIAEPADDVKADAGTRVVTYDYQKNWSLEAFLLRHAAQADDFDGFQTPNTVKLSFGNAPATPGVTGTRPDTVVFVTFSLQSPAAKDMAPKEGAPKSAIAVAGFPVTAPAIP